jgi:hypothetical protein
MEDIAMAKSTRNTGKEWTHSHEAKLTDMAAHNRPTGLIAWELGRTKAAVYAKASELGVSLKPVNKSPYNRQSR